MFLPPILGTDKEKWRNLIGSLFNEDMKKEDMIQGHETDQTSVFFVSLIGRDREKEKSWKKLFHVNIHSLIRLIRRSAIIISQPFSMEQNVGSTNHVQSKKCPGLRDVQNLTFCNSFSLRWVTIIWGAEWKWKKKSFSQLMKVIKWNCGQDVSLGMSPREGLWPIKWPTFRSTSILFPFPVHFLVSLTEP